MRGRCWIRWYFFIWLSRRGIALISFFFFFLFFCESHKVAGFGDDSSADIVRLVLTSWSPLLLLSWIRIKTIQKRNITSIVTYNKSPAFIFLLFLLSQPPSTKIMHQSHLSWDYLPTALVPVFAIGSLTLVIKLNYLHYANAPRLNSYEPMRAANTNYR